MPCVHDAAALGIKKHRNRKTRQSSRPVPPVDKHKKVRLCHMYKSFNQKQTGFLSMLPTAPLPA